MGKDYTVQTQTRRGRGEATSPCVRMSAHNLNPALRPAVTQAAPNTGQLVAGAQMQAGVVVKLAIEAIIEASEQPVQHAIANIFSPFLPLFDDRISQFRFDCSAGSTQGGDGRDVRQSNKTCGCFSQLQSRLETDSESRLD